jgi:ribosomal protein S18 acetylase RimI-like enzyme
MVPLVRHGKVFYIEENEKVIGSAQFMMDWNDHSRAYLVGISISKDCQGKGCGTVLLGDSMKSLSSMGIEKIELTVDPTNKRAIAVYEKLGFMINGVRKDEYGKGIDRVIMEAKL